MNFPVSIGIPAYNEEGNISNLLTALINQKTEKVEIKEIIVVSSGSKDRTDSIVEKFAKKDPRIRLITQKKREGKVSAINEFLKAANNAFLVMESADTIPGERTIENLCLPFEDPTVGLTGAHPIPTNDEKSFIGYVSHLEWALHDRISLRVPKCGELVAFRKVFDVLPKPTAVDEAWIEYEIQKRNYKKLYVPQAIVYNRGPQTISDFVKQRRRIACGHLDLDKQTNFEVSSSKYSSTLPAIFEVMPNKQPHKWFFFWSAFALELFARALGYYDYYVKKEKHSVWDVSTTTKSLGIAND